MPRQTSVLTNIKGSVVIDTNVFNNPEHALSGLEEFSHIWFVLLTHILTYLVILIHSCTK